MFKLYSSIGMECSYTCNLSTSVGVESPLHEVTPEFVAAMGCAPDGLRVMVRAWKSCTYSAPETSPEVTLRFCRSLQVASMILNAPTYAKVRCLYPEVTKCTPSFAVTCLSADVLVDVFAMLMHLVVQQVSNTLKFFRPRATW